MDWSRYGAALFDLDGVITPTAEVHMQAWSRMFNSYLTDHEVTEPYTNGDYFSYVDGKPRYDGVRSFLASRGIELPEGTPDDPPDADTIGGLGNRKNVVFTQTLTDEGVTAYPGSVALLDFLATTDVALAIVSSSRNAPAVLAAAGLSERFPVVVHGEYAAEQHLAGKPAPDTYLRAAELCGVPADAAVVLEDAVSGVAAGRAGSFGLVVGVDRGAGRPALLDNGADVVVDDLAELLGAGENGTTS